MGIFDVLAEVGKIPGALIEGLGNLLSGVADFIGQIVSIILKLLGLAVSMLFTIFDTLVLFTEIVIWIFLNPFLIFVYIEAVICLIVMAQNIKSKDNGLNMMRQWFSYNKTIFFWFLRLIREILELGKFILFKVLEILPIT